MASIRKSFSFRNGVQVDEDNFIVNANGLVGIGTSVPSEFLDVRGTAKVVGLTTTNDLFVSGVATATNIQVGTAISITGGGVKATNFFGNGATLSNLPTSQWEDVDVGLGFTSIYAIGNVGIATTDPRQSFQVGGDPSTAGKIGVGINSIGNIRASGIVTAASFVGAIAGPVTGDVTGDLTGDVTGNTAGNHTGGVTGNINSTGVSTFNSLNATNVVISGIATVGTALSFADNKVATFGDDHELDIRYNGSQAQIRCDSGDLLLSAGGSLNPASVKIQPNQGENSITAVHNGQVEIYHDNEKRFNTTTSGVEITNEIKVGTSGTVFSALSTGKVGIGTDTSLSDLTVKKASNTSVEVVSDTGTTKVSIGNSVSAGKSTGVLRFGNTSNTFDVINNDTGDLNFIIDGDNNSGTGNFKFVDNISERARITNDGKLGIAITNPAHQLHVVGTSTVTGNAFIGGNLSVGGTITGTLALGNVIEGTNILTTSGISTFKQINITDKVGFTSASPDCDVDFQTATASFGSIGIGTTNPNGAFNVQDTAFIDTLGINTTGIQSATGFNLGRLQIFDSKAGFFNASIRLDYQRFSQIGFGTFGAQEDPEGILDLSRAGEKHPTPWFKLPEMTTTRRNSLTSNFNSSGITTNSMIYNTTSKRIEIYLATPGSAAGNSAYWVGVATVA